MNSEGRISVCGRRSFVVLFALGGLAFGTLGLIALDPNALCLLPALALAVPLLMRRYPGERLLASFSCERRLRWPRPRSSDAHGARRFVAAPHGGLLIARALAVRPPPAPHAAI